MNGAIRIVRTSQRTYLKASNLRASMVEEKRAITVAKIWEGDALNRSKDAEILRTFTIGHLNLRKNAGEPRTYVLNLDANWGAGKSFFLNRFKQHLEAHGHISVYVRARSKNCSRARFLNSMFGNASGSVHRMISFGIWT